MTTYGATRATQLRVFLLVAAGIGLVLALLGLVQVVGDPYPFVVIVLVAGALAGTLAILGLRRLPERTRAARSLYCFAGVLQVVLGLLLAASVLGIVPIVVGLLLLMLALLREQPSS